LWIHLLTSKLVKGATSAAVVVEEETVAPSGGWETKKRRKRGKLTDEEAQGLIDYAKALETPEKIVGPEVIESSILEERVELPDIDLSKVLTDSALSLVREPSQERQVVPLEEKLEDEEDIGLMLAIIEAHEG